MYLLPPCAARGRLAARNTSAAACQVLVRAAACYKTCPKQQAEAVSVKRRGANRGAPTRGLGYTGGIKRNQAVGARSGAAGWGIPAELLSKAKK